MFDYGKGRVAYYGDLPLTADALIVVLLKSSGLQADASLKVHANLGALLVSNTEASFTNYARKTATSVLTTVDVVNHRASTDMDDITWSSAGNTGSAAGSGAGNNVLGKLIVCYDNDTGAGTDANLIPLTAHDFVASTDGNDLIAQIDPAGFYRAS